MPAIPNRGTGVVFSLGDAAEGDVVPMGSAKMLPDTMLNLLPAAVAARRSQWKLWQRARRWEFL